MQLNVKLRILGLKYLHDRNSKIPQETTPKKVQCWVTIVLRSHKSYYSNLTTKTSKWVQYWISKLKENGHKNYRRA